MSIGELAIRLEKQWVTRDRLIQQISRPEQSRFSGAAKGRQKKIVGTRVKIGRGYVVCGGLLNRILFAWRKPGLQVATKRHCDVALDREHIDKLPVLGRRPDLPVGPRIDQPAVVTHALASALERPVNR